ncbi:MAG: outer membrane beta-barrel protein, partial [Planctomycetaceae bacterium]|nr:outer membrane beta-barrel protein [Planctomycetaceae bacterium]
MPRCASIGCLLLLWSSLLAQAAEPVFTDLDFGSGSSAILADFQRVSTATKAGDDCGQFLCVADPCSDCTCGGAEDGTGVPRFYGWLNGGVLLNGSSPPSRFNGPYNAIDNDGGMFNQAYLIGEKTLDSRAPFDVGGRIDVLYGWDFFLAQSAGFELNTNGTLHWNNQYYGLAIPQAYGQFGNDELSVKIGHFYTPVGYEGVPATNNFFYSKAYSYMFAGPFTHWGGLAAAKLTDRWTAQAGLVNGWNALDRVNNQLAMLAGLKYTSDGWWTSFAIITGNEFNNVAGLPGITPDWANRTRYSWLVGLQPGEGWEYVFHQWLGSQAEGTASGGTALWYGIDQYLFYTLTSTWKFGGRFEWFRDEDGTRVGLNRPANPNNPPFPGSFYSGSVGFNWTPQPNLTIRPEIRV